MIRFYLDSNVFRYIKPKHPSYNRELHLLMDSLKDDVLFIYSGAHLDDLKDSSREFREEDLLLMTQYVKDHYFYRDPIKNQTNCARACPIDAYNSIDFDAMTDVLENGFDFDSLFKDLDDSEEERLAKQLIEKVFNMPLSNLGETIDTSNFGGKHKEYFDRMFPGYSPDMTLREFLRSIGQYAVKLLHNEKEVAEIRRYMEDYIKSETYSFDLWGMEFSERLKEKFGKNFLELIDGMLLENQKDNFHLRFNYAYTLLEMYNITQERSGKRKKLKKFNYWSLNRDSDHSYFASMCDYLVTDDRGLQVKAAIVYNLLGIETKILSTKDFVNQGRAFVNNETNFDTFTENFTYNINNPDFISIESIIENRNTVRSYKLKKPLLGFFKELFIIDYNEKNYRTCILSFKRPPNDNRIGFMYSEIEQVVNKLVKIFGKDFKGRENYGIKEEFGNGEAIRIWLAEGTEFQLFFQQELRWEYTELHIHTALS